jgi:hypothetical protein
MIDMRDETIASVSCSVHGPMKRRDDGWVCVGFDGEGCTSWITDDGAARVGQHEAYWPGVEINGVDWGRAVQLARERVPFPECLHFPGDD